MLSCSGLTLTLSPACSIAEFTRLFSIPIEEATEFARVFLRCAKQAFIKEKNFEEELKKFKPCLEVEDIEEAVYQEDLTDMTDILKEVMQQK